MRYYYSPTDENCKEICGGVREGQPFRLRLFGDGENEEAERTKVFLCIGKDGEEKTFFPMERFSNGWEAEVEINEKGLYFYSFFIENHGYFVYCDRHNGRLCERDESNFLLTVGSADYETPRWLKGGVMYQIFPDRFFKDGEAREEAKDGRIMREDWGGEPYYLPNSAGKVENKDFFGGNLRGIRQKLPYLQSMGVTAVYLNPIFEAASNHRYDTGNYMKIDPLLGDENDFRDLIDEGKRLGIRFILDGVFNHTGDDSVYFNKYGKYASVGAYQSKDSPFFSWYTFRKFPEKYDSWWGIDILPAVNEASEAYQTYLFGKYVKNADNTGADTSDETFSSATCADAEESAYAEKSVFAESGVLKKWLSYGIGGYRLDVADELPDFFLKKLRKCVKEENDEAVIIGEVWEDASDKIAYSVRRQYLQGEELDSVMNYPFKNAIVAFLRDGNSWYLAEKVLQIVDHYPKATLDCLMNILGTHDTARILTVLAGKTATTKDEMAAEKSILTAEERAEAVKKLKIAALLEYTLPGVPCTYYGDEIGMEGFGDPFCRRCFDEKNADEELLAYYRLLGEIRKNCVDVYAEGEYKEVFEKNGCFIFKRCGKRVDEAESDGENIRTCKNAGSCTKKTRDIYTCVNLSNENYALSATFFESGCVGGETGENRAYFAAEGNNVQRSEQCGEQRRIRDLLTGREFSSFFSLNKGEAVLLEIF